MKFAAVLVLALVASAVCVSADNESEVKPKKNKPKKFAAKVLGKPYFLKPITVPKGDSRAYAPGKAPARRFGVVVGSAVPQRGCASSPCLNGATCTDWANSYYCSCLPGYSGVQCQTPIAVMNSAPPLTALKAAAPVLSTNANPGQCLATFNGQRLATTASQWQQHYKSGGVIYSQGHRQFGYNARYADCSSFVTSVLDSLGWDCLFQNGRNTAAMIPLMRARGGFHQSPSVGDVVMWGGHTGIVTKVCPNGQAEMVAMGLHGCADTGCISIGAMQGWGSGGWLGFWTPRP